MHKIPIPTEKRVVDEKNSILSVIHSEFRTINSDRGGFPNSP